MAAGQGGAARPAVGGCALERLDSAGHPQARGPVERTGYRPAPVLSPGGQTLYVGGARLSALDAQSLKVRWKTPVGKEPSPYQAAILAPSPDGQTLAVSHLWSREALAWGEIELLGAATGKRRAVLRHPGPAVGEHWTELYRAVSALAFAPDGQTLALGSFGGGIRLHDLRTGQERTLGNGSPARPQAHAGQVRSLLWLDPHTLLSAANDETVKVWEPATGTLRRVLAVPGGVRELVRPPLVPRRLLALGAQSVTAFDPLTFARAAQFGPVVGGLQGWTVLGQRLRLRDTLSPRLGERSWDLLTGQESAGGTLALTELGRGGARFSVLRDLRVKVTRGKETYFLPFLALPPQNERALAESSEHWTLEQSGPRLTIGAAGWLRVMTMEGDTFQNRYVWNLDTRTLKDCKTVATGQMTAFEGEGDAGCRAAWARKR